MALRVLAVDTTTSRASVALVSGGAVLGELRVFAEAAHSRRLLPAVAFLLETLGLGPRDVEGYAVALGPGSFTGLRIGLSTIQGLALGHPAPCLGISALDALAARMRGAAPVLVALMDAWRDEVYAGVYDSEARPIAEPAAEPPAALAARLPAGPVAFLGDGALRYRGLLAEARPDAVFPERELFLAGTLGRLAEPRLSAGEGHEPGALRPLYVRDAGAAPPKR